MMAPEQAVFAAILTCMIAAGIALLLARWHRIAGVLAFLATAASAGLVGIAGIQALSGSSSRVVAGWLAAAARYHGIQVDGLSAVFLLLAAVVALPASLYSLRYLQHFPGKVAHYYPYSLIFLAAMYGLLSTTDTMWWFLIFWQLMIFSGYELIRFDRSASPRGANRFAIMLELACAAIVAGTGLLAHGAGTVAAYNWSAISAKLPLMLSLAPADGTLAFTLMLLGFGITMGLWPFGQMWLPQASPGAPATVSALLCGVVIKIGAYGLLRYFLFLVPANVQAGFPAAKWGMAIAIMGTITLFAGTMQALQQEQSKRLLAFHSVGQMGYIALAIGTCLLLAGKTSAGAAAIASFALLAALFHLLNHTLFASLLYFNAGSVLQATGTQDLNRLGGLMKYMPLTGLTALVGSLSISGVPLFNGFASKWAIYVATIQGATQARYLAVCAAIAILTSGLTLASFVKFFGAAFLCRKSALVAEKTTLRTVVRGEVRSRAAGAPAGSMEVGWSMQLPQLVLAVMCVLLGIAPELALAFLQHAIAATPQGLGPLLAQVAQPAGGTWAMVAAPLGTALFMPLALASLLGVSFLIAYGISRLGSAPRRAAAPWLCGYAPEAECERYIAHNFYGEIKKHFRWLGPAEDGKVEVVKGRAS
ncbi:MAG TPA: proton-conducting transporter membrane subunit [Terriglobales bacterium]